MAPEVEGPVSTLEDRATSPKPFQLMAKDHPVDRNSEEERPRSESNGSNDEGAAPATTQLALIRIAAE